MTSYFGVKELGRPEDWRAVSGAENWVPGRSAYELAHHWHAGHGFPAAVQRVFATAGEPFSGLIPKYGMVELPTFLDIVRAPSRTDLMLYCRTRNDEPFVIAVEGKATEPFDKPLNLWVRDGGSEPTRSRTRRLQFLSDLLGTPVSPDETFGYQLVHRTAAVVSECVLQGVNAGLVLVHSFSEANPINWPHFQQFAQLLGLTIPDGGKDAVHGSVPLGPRRDVAVSFAWICDQPVPPPMA